MGADGEPQRTAHLCRWGFGFAAGKKVDFTNEMGGRGGEVKRWRGGEADGESQRTAHLCRWGFGFAAGKKVVISLMKWGGYWNADGSEARASVPWLLKAAIRGGFTLGLDHFISEMAAFFQ